MNILVVGNVFDKHLLRFVKALRREDENLRVDVFDISTRKESLPEDSVYCSNIYLIKRYFPALCYANKKISRIFKYWDMKMTFMKVVQNHYDVLSVQYLTNHSNLLIKDYEKCADRIIFTPWGSDIYRQVDSILKDMSKTIVGHDVCIMPKSRFGEDCKKILSVKEEQCVPLCIGSDVLDDLSKSGVSKEDAKRCLFKKDCFVIVCGYNAAQAQNHLAAIDALVANKQNLPENHLVVLPMTYGGKENYVNQVKARLKESGLSHVILEKYLTSSEMICLRKATDLFIHIQTTDAYSSSLQEALLCDADVINGAWLPYNELEQFGKPYLTVENTAELPAVLEDYFKGIKTPSIPEQLKEVIKEYSWSVQAKKWISYFYKQS